MSPSLIFNIQLVLGYVAWMLCLGAYVFPRLRSANSTAVHRAIAALHSFRFFGLVFILPGVIGHNLPQGFAPFAAYGDFLTGLLAMFALSAIRIRPLFRALVFTFNLVGTIDIIVDYYHGVTLSLPPVSGELAATYAIVILYVPLLMITHIIAFYLMLRKETPVMA